MNSGFHGVHPIPAFLYYICSILFVMLFFHPLFLLTAFTVMLALWFVVDTQSKKKNILLAYLTMGIVIILFNPIFNRRGATILFYLFDQNVTLEAIMYGVLMALMLWSILFAFLSYNKILTANKMMYLFSRVLPRSTLVLRIAMRYIPLLLQRWRRVVEVQRTQGILIGTGSVKQRAHQGMLLFSILLTWSLEEAIETAQSMRARGYGMGKRTTFVQFRMSRGDWQLIFIISMLSIILLTGWLVGAVEYQVYPELGSLLLSLWGWIHYGCFCLLLLIPIYLELKEQYIWRNSKSIAYPSPILIEKQNL